MTKGDLIEGLMALQKPTTEPRSKMVRREIIENLLLDKDGQIHQEKRLMRIPGELMVAGDCWVILSHDIPAPSRIVVLDPQKRTLICHNIKN